MKIDIRPIIEDHLRSIKSNQGNKSPWPDYIIFFVGPVLIGCVAYYFNARFDRDACNASITFFGIFVALLLNIQMAMFAIYQRKLIEPDDDILKRRSIEIAEIRRKLLEELNSNTSYLILICCFSLLIVIASYVFRIENTIISSIIIVLYSHFLLTMLMVVKRAHALFQGEYRGD